MSCTITRSDAAQLRKLEVHVRQRAENRPGVYRMIAESGEVVYVGKSKRLRSRLLSYFRGSYPDDKGARIVREASSVQWTYVPSEFAALLEELRLIKSLRPRLNVALKRDARHYAFIGITRRTAPRLVVMRGTGRGGESTVYGPFSGAVRLREALRELSDLLGLRDCALDRRMRFADQREMFSIPPRTPGCIRYEIGKCLGPCVAAPTLQEYSERVSQARAFLDGAGDDLTTRLDAAMREASEKLEYERAAALRDKLRRLEDLREQFARLRFAVETLSFMYHVPGRDGDDRTYLIRRGIVRAAMPSPRSVSEEEALSALARRVFSPSPHPRGTSLPVHEVDELLVITSWFRTHPGELERTTRP